MQQSSSGVLVSIILIIVLGAAFALGIHYVSSGIASTALPAATATPQPTEVVGPATAVGTGRGKRTTHRSSGRPAVPTPAPPTPKPTAVPVPQARVVMSNYLGAGETPASKTDTFSTGVDKVYCVATFRHVGPSDSVAFRYSNADNGTQIWQSGPGDLVPAITSVEKGTSRATFLNGPLNSGKYRCDLLINNKIVNTAVFTVQ